MPTAGTTMPESLMTVPTPRRIAKLIIAARSSGIRWKASWSPRSPKRVGLSAIQNTPMMIRGSTRVIHDWVRISMFMPILRARTFSASPLMIESKKRPK